MMRLVLLVSAAAVLYVISYVVLLKHSFSWLMPYPSTPRPWIINRTAEYHFGGRAAGVFFWPVHRVDRLLRPSCWVLDISRYHPTSPPAEDRD